MKTAAAMWFVLIVVGCHLQGNRAIHFITLTKKSSRSMGYKALDPTFKVALEEAQQMYPNVLSNFTWRVSHMEDTNDASAPLSSALNVLSTWYQDGELLVDKLTVILAQVTTDQMEPIADFARETDNLIVPCTSDDSVFEDKKRFPTLISFSLASIGAYGQALLAVLDEFGWNDIVLLKDDLSREPVYMRIRIREFYRGITGALKLRASDFNFLELSMDTTKEDPRVVLRQASQHARIIVICTGTRQIQHVLANASSIGMTNGEYVYLFLYNSENPDDPFFATYPFNQTATELLQNVFIIRSPVPPWSRLQQGLSLIRSTRQDMFLEKVPESEMHNEFILQCYEAIHTVSWVLNESCSSTFNNSSNNNNNNTKCSSASFLAQKFFGRTFQLASRYMTFSKEGNRVVVPEIQMFDSTALSFRTMMTYNTASHQLLHIPNSSINWQSGTGPPLDRPACGIGSTILCKTVYDWRITVGIFVAAAFILLIILGLGSKWYTYTYSSPDASNWWCVGASDLQNYDESFSSAISTLTL